ncbi:hypothetical protein [Nonomuraea turcica]|uniref:hypothetical protein n=1 Tax=Nonomuraea sp. G32 TaxID=3067274 RepID=UPI00273B0ED6|nr:hypothetical protein [Nonomuraea sp. G32]MDP4511839.1 hypothetical protein [Nonomuraea sp. G32]
MRKTAARPSHPSARLRPAVPPDLDPGIHVSTEALRVIVKGGVIVVGLIVGGLMAYLGMDATFLATLFKIKM